MKTFTPATTDENVAQIREILQNSEFCFFNVHSEFFSVTTIEFSRTTVSILMLPDDNVRILLEFVSD